MKKFRKLLPALSMLLISALLMGSSTFAWFSMNTTVSATGMKATAVAPSSLLISVTNSTTGFGSTVELQNEKTMASSITPTYFNKDTVTGSPDWTYNFYKLTDSASASVDQNGQLTGTHASAGFSDATTYTKTEADHYQDEVWLKLEGKSVEAGKNYVLTFKANYTAEVSQAIKNAMHILIVNKTDGNIVLDYDMGSDNTEENLSVNASAETKQNLTITASNGSTLDVKNLAIYYFLSGKDNDCKNTNISSDTNLSVTLTFGFKTV